MKAWWKFMASGSSFITGTPIKILIPVRSAPRRSCRLNGGPLRGEGKYEARIACNLMSGKGASGSFLLFLKGRRHPYFTQEGEDREHNPNQYIADLGHGATAGFKYFAF